MLAAASTGLGDGFLQVLLGYGPLGVFAVAAFIFFNRAYKQAVERAEKAEAARAELERDMRDKVLPVMIAATQAVADATALLRERR